MKAITLWQPWASLIAIGAKRYETRSWKTSYRGPLAIHAAKKPIASTLATLDTDTKEIMKTFLAQDFRGDFWGWAALPVGCIVATCELVDCQPVEDVFHFLYKHNMEHETYFGDYSAGRFAWRLDDVQQLDTPIPVRGEQRLWEWEKPV